MSFIILADTRIDAAMWTSGSNLDCKSTFKWCTTKQTFYPNFPWGVVNGLQQPDNYGNNEWFTEIWMKPGDKVGTFFNDVLGSLNRRFICEVWFYK
jgi:hypothetical protein